MELTIIAITKKILLAIFLSGLIGSERELRQKGAGLRTHILVCVSSTLITLTAFYLSDIYKNTNVDPTRLLHGIITGIGFLCAGTIIRNSNQVSGLTTAASVWTVACIGITVGSGLFGASIIFTALVIFVLIGIGHIERWIAKEKEAENGRI